LAAWQAGDWTGDIAKEHAVADSKVRYLVFDVESVADGNLVSQVRYPQEPLTAANAIQRYRAELMEQKGVDFIPYTYQIPVAVVVAKVTDDFRLSDLALLDEPLFRPHLITQKFWRGWERYDKPTLVSFNGRSFDLPLLELAAFRYGVPLKQWFALHARNWDQPRNRYNVDAQLDLQELLVNYGATRFSGGLNLAANLLGKPGKMDIQGYMVQDLYDEGRLAEINDYCRCDVLDTYFVFLRCCVLAGRLSLDDEQTIVGQTKQWLIQRCDESAAYRRYLEQWGDWENPWEEKN
jgi:predicted PolB exonuclease-like 3'-5' exonuclease